MLWGLLVLQPRQSARSAYTHTMCVFSDIIKMVLIAFLSSVYHVCMSVASLGMGICFCSFFGLDILSLCGDGGSGLGVVSWGSFFFVAMIGSD